MSLNSLLPSKQLNPFLKIEAYLRGDSFDTGISTYWTSKNLELLIRIDVIIQKTLGQKVLHLGCADHIEVIREKEKSGSWLHGRLLQTTEQCVGVDINQEALHMMESELGIRNLIAADVTLPLPAETILNQAFDYVICGEILEHIDNPVAFLSGLHCQFKDRARSVLVTVPNAFALKNFLKALQHCEIINSDHRYWFTAYTLSKVAVRSGFKAVEIQFCESDVYNTTMRNKMKRWFLKRFPLFRDTLVLEMKF